MKKSIWQKMHVFLLFKISKGYACRGFSIMFYFIFVWKLLNSIRFNFFYSFSLTLPLSRGLFAVIFCGLLQTVEKQNKKKKIQRNEWKRTESVERIVCTTVKFMPHWNKLFALFFALKRCNFAMLMHAILLLQTTNQRRDNTKNVSCKKRQRKLNKTMKQKKINSVAFFSLFNRI